MRLKTEQLAKALELPITVLKHRLEERELPVFEENEEYVFNASTMALWAEENSLNFDIEAAFEEESSSGTFSELLMDAVYRGGVHTDVSGDSVEEVCRQAAALAPLESEEDCQTLIAELIQRENVVSTGIGKGVAVPHPANPPKYISEPSITCCFLEKPMDFKAVDRKPVFAVFLLLSPNKNIHLKLLSRLAKYIRDPEFIDFLRTKPLPEALLHNLETRESFPEAEPCCKKCEQPGHETDQA